MCALLFVWMGKAGLAIWDGLFQKDDSEDRMQNVGSFCTSFYCDQAFWNSILKGKVLKLSV